MSTLYQKLLGHTDESYVDGESSYRTERGRKLSEMLTQVEMPSYLTIILKPALKQFDDLAVEQQQTFVDWLKQLVEALA